LALLVAILSVVGGCGSAVQPQSSQPAGVVSIAPSSTGTSNSTASTSTGTTSGGTTPSAAPATPTPATPASTPATRVLEDIVWLCKPGLANNPCAGNLDATVVDASGRSAVQHNALAANPAIDCFYVYPTVSRQSGTNANLTIDPEERAVAVAQAALFSRVCNVYAPMYRQLTLSAIAKPDGISVEAALTAYASVSAAFADYLANYNHGRAIVFIGHSQGASLLIGLLKNQVDDDPKVRRLLVSALLLGGNVTVPIGKDVGGDFTDIPACHSTTQTGCVVAYSTFETTPPANALFGRATSSLNPFARSDPNLQVLCVNPAAPGGGTAAMLPYFPTSGLSSILGTTAALPTAATPFISYPNEYSAHCESSGGATWLQLDRTSGAADKRPAVRVAQAPQWGQHVVDVNIALGNLVELVASEASAFE
jgi:hypothetical protein